MDLIIELMDLLQSIEFSSSLVVSSSNDDREIYLEVLKEEYREFVHLERKGTILFPVEIFGAVRESYNASSDLVVQFANNNDATEAIHKLRGANVRLGLIVREIMGIDALSTQSTSLFTNKKAVKKLADISVDEMAILAQNVDFLQENKTDNV